MLKAIEYSIGLRYVRSKKRNHFISFITFTSVIGVAIGITVIITVLSVMNGFKHEIQTKFLDFTAHGFISSYDGTLQTWKDLEYLLERNEEITALAPYAETQAMLTHHKQVSGTYVKGILPEMEIQVSNIEQYMVQGSLTDLRTGGWNIILGQALADYLGVTLNDKITLVTSQASITPAGVIPRLRRFTVSGIFKLGMSQYDRQLALIHIEDAQKINRLEDRVNGIHMRYRDLYKAPEITQYLQAELSDIYWVSDWTKRHSHFFRALEMEKLILLIIMTFIIAIAAFNIISALVMVVTEKQGDIAVLKTMGMTPTRILKIFIVQGCVIGIIGMLLGVGGGVLLASYLEEIVVSIETLTGSKFLSPDVYPITEVPSQLLLNDVLITAALAFFITVIATLYPAWRAAQVRPSDALRYE